MSRAAMAATLGLALAALTLPPVAAASATGAFASTAAPAPPAPPATTAGCAWQRHSKRVVRHLKRHGRLRRQVRVKRWWACVPQTPAATSTPAPTPTFNEAPASPEPPAPSPPDLPEVGRLSVKAEDESEPWSFTLSRPSVAAGEVIVELNNKGGDPHNLNLLREGGEEAPLAVSEAGPLERRTGRFTLAPGSYRLWCSLPEHDEKGMHATLTVSSG